MLLKIFHSLKHIQFSQLSAKFKRCAVCGFGLQLKIYNDEMGVRCLRCRGSAVTQSLAHVFKQTVTDNTLSVYELSSRGAWWRYLHASSYQLCFSEFFSDIPKGSSFNGVLCQDIQALTFDDEQFDVCTSLEVFEHVEDDDKGFSETLRVLKPGGMMLFTVPMTGKDQTIERTAIINGVREHVLPPEYHSDHLQGENQVFCYRNYGNDITERMIKNGFIDCQIIEPVEDFCFGYGRPVVIGFKPT